MADAPLVGLDPHPGTAPEPAEIAPETAEGWAEIYMCKPSLEEARALVQMDFDGMAEAVAAGDLEDMDDLDDILAVDIHDDGRMDVLASDEGGPVLVTYTPEDIYRRAFGMTPPSPAPREAGPGF